MISVIATNSSGEKSDNNSFMCLFEICVFSTKLSCDFVKSRKKL